MPYTQSAIQDVAVIGGSAAGLLTAWQLAKAGRQVRVYESAPHLDPSPRTLIVTGRLLELLGPLARKAVVNEITQYEIFGHGRATAVDLERPELVIERATLIKSLLDEARQAGAEIVFGSRFLGAAPDGNGLTISLGGHNGLRRSIRTRTLVGADGAFSSVATSLGFSLQPTAPLIQAVIRVPEGVACGTARVWFAPDDTPYFYWLVPESPTRAVLGLIGQDGRRTRQCLERFLSYHGWQAIEFQAARIPIYSKWLPVSKRFGHARAYLVGDAAGHVKVTTVGGIVTGFCGALAVTEAILNGGPGRQLRVLKRELNLHLWVRRAMHRFSRADYDALIDVLNEPAKRVLGRITRDEPVRLVLRVCLRQPRLLMLAFRAFFSGRRVASAFSSQPSTFVVRSERRIENLS